MKVVFFKFVRAFILLTVIIIGIYGAYVATNQTKPASASWFDEGFYYRRSIPITNSTGSTQIDFQVQLTLDTSALVTAGTLQSDCDDLRFTSDTGNKLNYWLEPNTCNTTTTLVFVKVPSIPTTGTTLYFYYGNPSASSESRVNGTFIREISGVVGAWDMDESSANSCSGGTNDLCDSSGNDVDGAWNGNVSSTTGKFSNGTNYTGAVDDYINIPDNDMYEGYSQITVSTWVYDEATPAGQHDFFTKGGEAGGSNSSWSFYRATTAGYNFRLPDGSTNYELNAINSATGGWDLVTATYDGATVNLYVNAQLEDSANRTGNVYETTHPVRLGSSAYFNDGFDGKLDNARIYNKSLSSDEVTDLYNNHGYTTTNYPGKELVRKYNTSIAVGTLGSQQSSEAPVAYWKFDEGQGQTIQDATTNNLDGTLGANSSSASDDPTWVTEDLCVSGKCLKFDGSNDYINLQNPDKLDSQNTITVTAWIKSNTIKRSRILANGDSSNAPYIEYVLGTTIEGYGRFEIQTSGSTSVIFTNTVLNANQWYLLSGTWDGTTMRIYLNGNLSGSGSKSGNITEVNNSSFIGGSTQFTEFFNGFIDEPKIYSYALSADQIKSEYASGKAGLSTSQGVKAAIGGDSNNLNQSLSNGLVGYWKMDESSWNGTTGEVIDLSGNSNHGTRQDNATTTAGKYGNGANLDGTNDFIQVGSSNSLSLQSSLTVSAWVYRSSNLNQSILTSVNTNGYELIYSAATGYRFRVKSEGTSYDVNTNVIYKPYEWYLITGTFDSNTRTLTVYINGDQISTTQIPINQIASYTSNFKIGSNNNEANWNGRMDDTRIYNRALSPAEVQALYNWAPEPVGHWKMDEKSGTTINDSSGSNNGTLYNSTSWTTGKTGGAISLNGTSDYALLTTTSTLNINGGTVTLWTKPSSSQNESTPHIFSHRANGSERVYLQTNSTGTSLSAILGSNSTNIGSATINANAWNHAAITWNGSVGTLYVNGANVTSTPSFTALTSMTDSYLGSFANTNSYFAGQIDDVRIYNYARTQKQIIEDMNAGSPSVTTPLAYWNFNEGNGTTANNKGSGGSTLNGTLTNMSSPATSTSGWTNNGKFGKGLVFDGNNDYITGSDSALPLGSVPRSITVWINPNALPTSGAQMMIFGYGTQVGGQAQALSLINNSGTQQINYSGWSSDHYVTFTTPTNSWTHLSAVYDGSYAKVYANGKLLGSLQRSWSTVASNFTIGQKNGNYFNGSIDEVKVYPFALTDTEVIQDYNQGKSLTLGATSTSSDGTTPSNSAAREYCVPGDTSTCNPPVGEFKLDEGSGTTVFDTSGNGNNGTWNGTSATRWSTGKLGKSGVFNGTDDFIGRTSYITSITDNFTLSGWINPSILPQAGISAYNGNDAGGYGFGISTGFNGSSGSKLVGLFGGVAWIDSGYTFPNSNQWYYISMVRDSGTTSFYVNGTKTSGTSISAPSAVQSYFSIGCQYQTSNTRLYFNGKIDQVRIYNYARTPAQIAWDYNKGAPIAHWKFNECSGTTANDTSGNENHGTITAGDSSGSNDSVGSCTGSTGEMWKDGATGKFSSSLEFDGTNDHIDMGDPADGSLDLGTNNLSLSAWIKTSSTASFQEIIAKKNDTSSSSGYSLELYQGRIALNLSNGSTFQGFISPSGTTYFDGLWHHVVAVWNSTAALIYVDGKNVLNDTGVTFSGSVSTSSNLRIGSTSNDQRYFNGQIDDVRIYNYALTAEQVKSIMNDNAAIKF